MGKSFQGFEFGKTSYEKSSFKKTCSVRVLIFKYVLCFLCVCILPFISEGTHSWRVFEWVNLSKIQSKPCFPSIWLNIFSSNTDFDLDPLLVSTKICLSKLLKFECPLTYIVHFLQISVYANCSAVRMRRKKTGAFASFQMESLAIEHQYFFWDDFH